jgi:hypothetical protein
MNQLSILVQKDFKSVDNNLNSLEVVYAQLMQV